MKLSFLLMFVFMLQVSAEGYSQNAKLNLSVQNKTMLEVIRTIEKQSDYRFFFSDNYEELSKVISIEANGESLNDVMENLLRDKSISYKLLDGNIVVLAPSKALQQQTLTGKVVDVTNNDPVIGANILVEGTTIGVVTDVNGKFSIDLPKSDAVLVVSYIGYNSERVQVNGQTTLNIALVPDIKKLDEVVVIGYGAVKKSDLTGSVKVLNNNNMADVSAIGLDQMLQGNAAGVQVTTASGEPGAGVRIRIRGGNSINGDNSPLYVIDGFPISNNQMGDAKGLGQSGQAINPLSSIDPADIVGMQILKDASATAIYGSRGANGVIIITTKRGKKGGMTVDFGASVSSSIIRKKLEMLSAFDFATLANTIVKTGGQAAEYSNPEALQTINWQDEIFQTAVSQNYNLSVTGGNEATKVALGINWLDQNGVLKNSAFKRGNVRLNVDHTISKIIRTGANINISTSNGALGQTNEGIGNTSLSSIGTALTFQPFEVALDDPTYNEKILKDPRKMIKVTDDYNNVRVLSGAWAEIDILPSLKLKGNFGGDFSTSDRDRFWPKTTRWGASMNGVSSHTNSIFYSYLSEYTLTYSKNIEDHNFTGLAGYTWQNFVNKYGYQQSNNFIDDGLGVWGMENGTSYLPSAYYKDESNLISWLARVNYDYKKRYYVTISGRYDGSSKFGANNKWALFPSTALAWKISEEPFMKNVNVFSSLKLRGSFGQSGSQAIGAYQSLVKIYGANTSNNGVVVAGTQVGNLSNPDLSWETTTQSDVGIDMAFFNNRLRFSFDYYNKVTKDLLLQKQIPISSGFGSIWTNFGKIRNNGLEIEMGANIIESENLNWETDANISFNRNKVLELGMPVGANGFIEYYSTNIHSYNGIRAPGHVSREGKAVAQFYGYRTDGLYRTADEVAKALPGENAYLGGIRRKDLNSDNKIDKLDQTIIGSPHPDLIFGVTNTIIYKNWNLQFMVTGSIGNEIYNANLNSIATMRDNKNNVLQSVYLDSWSSERPDAKYPAPNQAAIADISSDYLIEDGSYVRLKSLEIGYRIPTKVPWIKQAKIIISATNLFTITDYSGYDPEVDSFSGDNLRPGVDYNSYPTSRTYKLGFNFTF